MRRILLVLSVAALMVAMMVVMAAPSLAARGENSEPSCDPLGESSVNLNRVNETHSKLGRVVNFFQC